MKCLLVLEFIFSMACNLFSNTLFFFMEDSTIKIILWHIKIAPSHVKVDELQSFSMQIMQTLDEFVKWSDLCIWIHWNKTSSMTTQNILVEIYFVSSLNYCIFFLEFFNWTQLLFHKAMKKHFFFLKNWVLLQSWAKRKKRAQLNQPFSAIVWYYLISFLFQFVWM